MHPALQWILHQLRESRVAPGSLRFYLTLLSLSARSPQKEAPCQASAAQLAGETGFSSRTVQLAREEIERLGWIRVERTRVHARGRSPQAPNRYHLVNPPPGWQVTSGTMHPALRWLLDQFREANRKWSRGTLLVYLYLLSRTEVIPPHQSHCQPSVGQIGKDTGLSKRGVGLAVADLQGRGFVEVRARRTDEWRDGGRRKYMRQVPNLYFIQQFPPEWRYRQSAAPTSRHRLEELQKVDDWYARRADSFLSRSAATDRQTEKARQEYVASRFQDLHRGARRSRR